MAADLENCVRDAAAAEARMKSEITSFLESLAFCVGDRLHRAHGFERMPVWNAENWDIEFSGRIYDYGECIWDFDNERHFVESITIPAISMELLGAHSAVMPVIVEEAAKAGITDESSREFAIFSLGFQAKKVQWRDDERNRAESEGMCPDPDDAEIFHAGRRAASSYNDYQKDRKPDRIDFALVIEDGSISEYVIGCRSDSGHTPYWENKCIMRGSLDRIEDPEEIADRLMEKLGLEHRNSPSPS